MRYPRVFMIIKSQESLFQRRPQFCKVMNERGFESFSKEYNPLDYIELQVRHYMDDELKVSSYEEYGDVFAIRNPNSNDKLEHGAFWTNSYTKEAFVRHGSKWYKMIDVEGNK